MKKPGLLSVVASFSLLFLSSVPAQEVGIVERGQDYAVYQRVASAVDESGNSVLRTNQFTVLENGLNARDAVTGEWRQSEDLIESVPNVPRTLTRSRGLATISMQNGVNASIDRA